MPTELMDLDFLVRLYGDFLSVLAWGLLTLSAIGALLYALLLWLEHNRVTGH